MSASQTSRRESRLDPIWSWLSNRSPAFYACWAAVWLAAAITVPPAVHQSTSAVHAKSQSASQLADSITQPVQEVAELITKPIQDIRVGERVLARNPEFTEEERGLMNFVPDLETWRAVKLTMEKLDGTELEVEILWPVEWIEFVEAHTGGTVELDMPEFGARGNANVCAIEPCPSIEDGDGQVVTGTFKHLAANVIDLYVDQLAQPIGVTATHPFWSEDRSCFVPAGELKAGERLRTLNGTSLRVVATIARSSPEVVYNLQVAGEHAYFVSELGILVHNAYPRSLAAKQGFLRGLATDPNTAKWMKPWLRKGLNPPGFDVDHILPLSVGAADTAANMRLILREDHWIWHKYYHPWR